MLSSDLETMKADNATATNAGARTWRLPVISATMIMTASGAREMPPKTAIMPTTTYGAGVWPTPGAKGSKSLQNASPVKAPITIPGPKTPPEPPVPIEKAVAAMRANGSRRTIHSGVCSSSLVSDSWTQP